MAVMLGFKDEAVKPKDFVDWSCNKLGGTADWMMSSISETTIQPQCKMCCNPMYLMVQIYCPLVGSVYHRTLFVYGCSQRCCWNKPESFSVIRCQKKEVKDKEKAPTKIETDDWGTNDWGADDWDTKEKQSTIEEDIVDVETRQQEITMEDLIQKMAESFNFSTTTTQQQNNTQTPHCFTPYHIYVMDENNAAKEGKEFSDDYEMQLYQEYVGREGEVKEGQHQNNNNNNTKHKGSKCSTNGDGNYEKTKVKHGDSAFYQFTKRIRPCPKQCLRYDWKGSPLILSNCSKITPPLDAIPKCPKCDSARVFEMQLMPNLVTCLHEPKMTAAGNSKQRHIATNGQNHDEAEITWTEHARSGMFIDFGCLYIFTCSQSCWRDGDDVISLEVIAMQSDPETAILS